MMTPVSPAVTAAEISRYFMKKEAAAQASSVNTLSPVNPGLPAFQQSVPTTSLQMQ
jgi:hypothetical protein